jgi:hypothetical protein
VLDTGSEDDRSSEEKENPRLRLHRTVCGAGEAKTILNGLVSLLLRSVWDIPRLEVDLHCVIGRHAGHVQNHHLAIDALVFRAGDRGSDA